MKKTKINRSSGIGGQAVLEGVMMKNNDTYAVAVRKPNGEIEIETQEFVGVLRESKCKKMPFVRGVFNFIDSLMLGMRALTFSSSFYEEENTQETKTDKLMNKIFKEKAEKVFVGLTIAFSIVMAFAIFMILPYFLSSILFHKFVRNLSLLAIFEGVLRILIFVLYIVAISAMKDIRRVYQYHGAEHKCINCIEKGRPLTIRNVMRSSKQHKRCGTSFMLFVMFVSIVLFFFIRVENPVYRVLIRILLIPVIAGISYEIIRLAGRSNHIIVRIISAPGMLLQRLTTREPEEDMVEVAIASVEAVFDWKKYLLDTFGYEVDDSWLDVEADSTEEAGNNDEPKGN